MNLEDTFASLRIENEEIKKKLEAIDLKLLNLERKMQSSENVLQVGSKIGYNVEQKVAAKCSRISLFLIIKRPRQNFWTLGENCCLVRSFSVVCPVLKLLAT